MAIETARVVVARKSVARRRVFADEWEGRKLPLALATMMVMSCEGRYTEGKFED